MSHIHPSWQPLIDKMSNSEELKATLTFVKEARNVKSIYPPSKDVYNVLSTGLDDIKVVIIGQDPYHGHGQAHGYSFSVPDGIKPPPSLVNIYKEISDEFGISMNKQTGNLLPWVNQGVFLLNTSLTVEASNAGSHSKIGWDLLTNAIIEEISKTQKNVVFLLWGAHAATMEPLIKKHNEHLILMSAHPSPFSAHRGFLGNGHFKKANNYLQEHGKTPINWQI